MSEQLVMPIFEIILIIDLFLPVNLCCKHVAVTSIPQYTWNTLLLGRGHIGRIGRIFPYTLYISFIAFA